MQLDHSFDVPGPVHSVYTSLLDVELVAGCMPGATLRSVEGDAFTGDLKVKLGPIVMTYNGEAEIVEKDPVANRVVLVGSGRDARGNGTAAVRIVVDLEERDAVTRVLVAAEMAVTGKPAQFGRGVMQDVGDKLVGRFAETLAGRLSADVLDESSSTTPIEQDSRRAPDALPLIAVVGPVMAKKIAPTTAVALVAWLLTWAVRRRASTGRRA